MRNFSFGIVRSTRAGLGLWLAAATLVFGCEKPGNSDPFFRLNDQGIAPSDYTPLPTDDAAVAELKIGRREYLASALEAMFGTPDRPFVFRESGLDLKKIWRASGPAGGMRPDAAAKQREELQNIRAAKKKTLEGELTENVKRATIAAAKPEADLKAAQTRLTAARTAKNDAEVAAIEKEISVIKLQLEPKAKAEEAVAVAKGEIDDLSLVLDSSAVQQGLYRQHCVHCHGVTGDGAGPTALFLFPYPRDYRQGIFKFKSTKLAAKPTHADLMRILDDGIPDTAMPSFRLLKPDEREALVEYVKYLAIRGQTESLLRDELDKASELPKPERSYLLETALQGVADAWNDASSGVIEPRDALSATSPHDTFEPKMSRAEWLEAGKSLFLGEKTKCYSCHGTTGLGDGRNNKPFYDEWNKKKAEVAANLLAAENSDNKDAIKSQQELLNTWLLPVQQQYPRNFRLNRFRFGRRPLDVYRRVAAGIAGTEMQGFATVLTDKEIWQLVDFVMELPYEPLGYPAGGSSHGSGGVRDDHDSHKAARDGHATNAPADRHVPARMDAGAKPNEQARTGEAKSAGGE